MLLITRSLRGHTTVASKFLPYAPPSAYGTAPRYSPAPLRAKSLHLLVRVCAEVRYGSVSIMSSCAVSLLALLLGLSMSEPGACEADFSGVLEPYDLLFDSAVEAYYRQDWPSVILNMERALRNKGLVRKVKAQCRVSCANLTAFHQHGDPGELTPLPGAGPVQDLGFFQRVLKRAECVTRCEAEKLGPPSMHKVSEEVKLEFKKRTPYNYLQVAYFKVNHFFFFMNEFLHHHIHASCTASPLCMKNNTLFIIIL